MESAYNSACLEEGIKPLDQVLESLIEESPSLTLSSETCKLNDNDFFGLGILFKLSPIFLEEITICGYKLSENALNYLSEGLESNKSIRKLSLVQGVLSGSKAFVTFLSAVQESALEEVSLAGNELNDDCGAYIACLLESNFPLRGLVLDDNKFKDFSFALSLAKNKSLLSFEINNNPLDFTNVVSLLEMLTINKSLEHLGVSGTGSKAPAPIKENPSGLLTINEALTLKLANILRYSSLTSISIDLDPECSMQLKELEISISKHNRTLINLSSPLINWNSVSGILYNIQRALKANLWLNDRTQEIPQDIEDLIVAKLGRKETVQSESFKSSPSKISPNKTPHKVVNRKDSTESKNSDTTIVENKNIKEMSFGKSAISKYLKKDDSLNKFIQGISGKMSELEEKFNLYTSKTDSYMERIEQQISESRRGEDLTALASSVKEIQAKLDQIETEKMSQKNVVEEYIQKLEALKFKESEASSKRSSRRLRAQKFEKESFDSSRGRVFNDTQQSIQSDDVKGRICNLEQKIQRIETDSMKINKFGQKLKGTMGKVARLEGAVQDILCTPKKVVNGEMQSTQKGKEGFISLPGDAESVVIGALMDKARNMKVNDSFYRSRNMNSSVETKRAPSAELKQCLKSRGFTIEGDRPVFRKFRLD